MVNDDLLIRVLAVLAVINENLFKRSLVLPH